jgi:hypothetical protein
MAQTLQVTAVVGATGRKWFDVINVFGSPAAARLSTEWMRLQVVSPERLPLTAVTTPGRARPRVWLPGWARPLGRMGSTVATARDSPAGAATHSTRLRGTVGH